MAGGYVQSAVSGAQTDMSSVHAAADAITAAINAVKPLLGGQTWTGPAADAWEGDWNSFYASVLSCLNDLPAAEASVISGVQAQAEQQLKEHPNLAHVSFS